MIIKHASRNPLLDPQHGDKISKPGAGDRRLWREVNERAGNMVSFITREDGPTTKVWITSWHNWATDAQVDIHGDNVSKKHDNDK